MQKVRAFTLLELLVGMIISSIVIGFCYMSYSIIYKQYLNYKILRKEIVETIQLNSILNTGFVNAETVEFNSNRLVFNSQNGSQLQYDFTNNFIIRKDREVIDTFKLAATNVIAKDYMESEQSAMAIINDFAFDAKIAGETVHFHFTKNYSAEILVNNSILNLQKN